MQCAHVIPTSLQPWQLTEMSAICKREIREFGITVHESLIWTKYPYDFQHDLWLRYHDQGKYPSYGTNNLKGKFPSEEINQIGGMTRSGRIYAPIDIDRRPKENKIEEITEDEMREFIKTLHKTEFSIAEQLRKTPANINLLTLLLTSETHREALVTILKQAQVPRDTSPELLQELVGSIMSPRIISFTDDEIPTEGKGHTKALHIAVKTRGMVVARVLIDNCSVQNVCP